MNSAAVTTGSFKTRRRNNKEGLVYRQNIIPYSAKDREIYEQIRYEVVKRANEFNIHKKS